MRTTQLRLKLQHNSRSLYASAQTSNRASSKQTGLRLLNAAFSLDTFAQRNHTEHDLPTAMHKLFQ